MIRVEVFREEYMKHGDTDRLALIDGSRLIVEACMQGGSDSYVGYPITPANYIYAYSSRRLPMVLSAPDEITALQWMIGLSARGRLPMTATSFAGFALMIESINMAFMMELPMLIVLVQRLGPSTGSATVGAQGDLLLLRGMISGGYHVPVLCIPDIEGCWKLPPVCLQIAVDLRTPVVLLTSKEMIMTQRSLDLDRLQTIEPVNRPHYDGQLPYVPYAVDDTLVPDFLAVGNDHHQVRLTASTHNAEGILLSTAPEALANSRRLQSKIERGTPTLYRLDEEEDAETLIVTYGITTGAAREAVNKLRRQSISVSLLEMETLLPIPPTYYDLLDRYPRVVVAEENIQGQLAHLLFGHRLPKKVRRVNSMGRMVRPEEIVQEAAES
ncbi:MAG TPA: hypothetical protein ENN19_12365 [Chloroflexi bacterium]|nr:hypothetical protein [Chloroflexota bacterium]